MHACRSTLEDPTDRIYRGLKGDPGDLMRETSRTLSSISRYVGLVTAPRFVNTSLKQIEFVRLKRRKVLAILVSREGIIQNRLMVTERDHPQRELDRMAALLNERYADLPLSEIRASVVREMADEKALYDQLLSDAMGLGRETFTMEEESNLYVEGASNIFSLPDFADLGKMRALFEAFEEKSHIVGLLDRCIDADRVRIFIGAENPHRDMQELSLVTAPYRKDGRVLGVIGVLGPTRMAYDRVIPMVDYSARQLTRLLTNRF